MEDIKYLGHGCDCDAYSITIQSCNCDQELETSAMVYKFARSGDGYNKVKLEMIILPQLLKKLESIDTKIQIPDYNIKLSCIQKIKTTRII